MKQYLLILLLWNALNISNSIPIKISKESIQSIKKNGFDTFIENKKKQYQLMTRVTRIPIIGSIVSWGLETIGNVDIKEAEIFLGRIFTDEAAFLKVVEAMEDHPQNVTYLQHIFDNISSDIIQKKSKEELVTAMRRFRHEEVPVPKKMGEKNADGQYTLTDHKFYNFAACSLFALHAFEQETKQKRHTRKRRTLLSQHIPTKGLYETYKPRTTIFANRSPISGHGASRNSRFFNA